MSMLNTVTSAACLRLALLCQRFSSSWTSFIRRNDCLIKLASYICRTSSPAEMSPSVAAHHLSSYSLSLICSRKHHRQECGQPAYAGCQLQLHTPQGSSAEGVSPPQIRLRPGLRWLGRSSMPHAILQRFGRQQPVTHTTAGSVDKS